MNNIELDSRFFMGGNATFTIENNKGTHYTFKIRQPKNQRPGYTGPAPHFISLLTGPDNENSYTYMGIVEEKPIMEPVTEQASGMMTDRVTYRDTGRKTLRIRLTAKSKYNDDSTPVRVARWALHLAMTGGRLPEGYAIHHEGKCGCCGRTLTVPASLTSGIGPECAKRLGLPYGE